MIAGSLLLFVSLLSHSRLFGFPLSSRFSILYTGLQSLFSPLLSRSRFPSSLLTPTLLFAHSFFFIVVLLLLIKLACEFLFSPFTHRPTPLFLQPSLSLLARLLLSRAFALSSFLCTPFRGSFGVLFLSLQPFAFLSTFWIYGSGFLFAFGHSPPLSLDFC